MNIPKKVLYPGTFDPVTFGHIDLIKRASQLFDEVVVGVAHNVGKSPLFSSKERLEMISIAIKGLNNVEVLDFDCLAVDFARKIKAQVLVRGMRMFSDFEYEFQMALTNRKLAPDLETIFLMPHESYSYISSKLVKEIAALGKKISDFVPDFVEIRLVEKFKCG